MADDELELPSRPRRSRTHSLSVNHEALQTAVRNEMARQVRRRRKKKKVGAQPVVELRPFLVLGAQGRQHTSEEELVYFFTELGLPKFYFTHTPPAEIARHVLSLQAAKQLARLRDKPFDVDLSVTGPTSAFFATTSGVTTSGFLF
jgi:hypothetical protein